MACVSQNEILEVLNSISDQQAVESDYVGDSDAENTLCVSNISNTTTRKTRGSKREIEIHLMIVCRGPRCHGRRTVAGW
jgi:hypothetical protein